MIDLETMGTGSDAAIASIGLCGFNLVTGTIDNTAHFIVDLQSSIDVGMTIDASTLYWWLNQSDDARSSLGVEPKLKLHDALLKLHDYIDENTIVWGNGVDFDIAILDTAYKQLELKTPWGYRNKMCLRTLRHLEGDFVDASEFKTGTHHNAVDDAVFQAKWACAMYNSLMER